MKPLIVGPWLGEVGFELLYWIPFLRRTLARIPRERPVWILSRGGCRLWYADLSPNYLELYDWYSPDALARLNEKRIAEQRMRSLSMGLRRNLRSAKQLFITSVERELIAVASRKAWIADAEILHPSLMYEAFRPYWKRERPDLLGQWTRTCASARMTPPKPSGVPASYVAVKFYASQANPENLNSQTRVAEMVKVLADHIDVVLLHTGTRYDEHGEFVIPKHPHVHRRSFMPGSNLDQQTAIIGGAVGYVGTYGGFAYLGPFIGVPTLAFYGVKNFRRDHLRLMTQAARQLQTPFDVTHLEKGIASVRSLCRSVVAHAA